jgi:hypothetical protein
MSTLTDKMRADTLPKNFVIRPSKRLMDEHTIHFNGPFTDKLQLLCYLFIDVLYEEIENTGYARIWSYPVDKNKDHDLDFVEYMDLAPLAPDCFYFFAGVTEAHLTSIFEYKLPGTRIQLRDLIDLAFQGLIDLYIADFDIYFKDGNYTMERPEAFLI